MTQSEKERIAILETVVEHMRGELQDVRSDLQGMSGKLDELLTLKARGQGAFWLATALFGTSIAAAISYIIGYFK